MGFSPGAGSHQEVNWALVDQLRPFFQPGLRPIAEYRLAAPAASVIFANIPGNYRSLLVNYSARDEQAAESDNLYLQCNGDAANNYDFIRMYATCTVGLTVDCLRATGAMLAGRIEAANSTANTFSGGTVMIYNYAAADRWKRITALPTGTFGNVSADADLSIRENIGQWRSLVAINRLTFFGGAGNLSTGCIFTLYGVL